MSDKTATPAEAPGGRLLPGAPSSALRDCPFCAGETPEKRWREHGRPMVYRDALNSWHVRCPACGANFGMRLNEKAAITAWNRRPNEASSATAAEKGST